MERDYEKDINYDDLYEINLTENPPNDGMIFWQSVVILEFFTTKFLCSSSDLKFYDIMWQESPYAEYNIFWVSSLTDEGEMMMDRFKGTYEPGTEGSTMLVHYIEVIRGTCQGIYEILDNYNGIFDDYYPNDGNADEENINYDFDDEYYEPYMHGMFILKVFNERFLCSSLELDFYDINWQMVAPFYYNIHVFYVNSLSDEGERTMNMLKGRMHATGSSLLAQYIEVNTERIRGIFEILHSHDGMYEGYGHN